MSNFATMHLIRFIKPRATHALTIPLLLAASLACAAGDNGANPDSGPSTTLDEVIVTASKLNLTPDMMTQSTSLVSAAQIQAQAQTSVTDVLRQLPGLQFQVAGAPGQFIYPRLRGFSDSTLYVFDGITLNTAGSGGIGYLLGQIDPTMVQGIQVLRGPHATTYGANTTSGVIDITTLQGRQQQADLSLEAGSLRWLKGRAGIQNRVSLDSGTWDYSLNGSYLDTNGVNQYEYTKNGTVVGRTSFRSGDFQVGGSVFFTDNKFQFAALVEPNPGAPPPYYSAQIPDPSNVNSTQAGIASLWLQQALTESLSQKLTLGMVGQSYATQNKALSGGNLTLGNYTSPYDGWQDPQTGIPYNAGDTIPFNKAPYTLRTINNNYEADYNLHYDTETITAVAGATYLTQYYNQYFLSDLYGDTTPPGEHWSIRSVYGNASLGWFNNALHTNAGVRLDSYSAWQSKATWSLGATYDFTPGLSLYTNYGTSFTQPTLDQLYSPQYGNNGQYASQGVAGVTPANANTIEVGIRARQLDDAITESVTYWHSYVNNVIVLDYTVYNPNCGYSDYCGVYINKNAERSQGVEAEIAWKITPRLTLNGNYTRTDAYITGSTNPWSFMPMTARNTGNLGVDWSQARFNAGANLYMTDHRLRYAGDFWAPGYARLDLYGRWHVTPAFDLYGRVQNALDHNIVEQLGYRNPGMYITVGASYRFR